MMLKSGNRPLSSSKCTCVFIEETIIFPYMYYVSVHFGDSTECSNGTYQLVIFSINRLMELKKYPTVEKKYLVNRELNGSFFVLFVSSVLFVSCIFVKNLVSVLKRTMIFDTNF